MKKKQALVRSGRRDVGVFNLHEYLQYERSLPWKVAGREDLIEEFFRRFPKKAEPGSVQEALEYSFLLNGGIKSHRIAFLRLGRLLAYVRDMKLYVKLKHPNIEEYAWEHLRLNKSSLYRYLNAYDWVFKNHSAWLLPKPKGFIPDVTRIDFLRWLTAELAKTNLSEQTRAELKALEAKALEGRLTDEEIRDYRHSKRRTDGLVAFLSTLRSVRKRGALLKGMPREALSSLDTAINLIYEVVKPKRSK